MNKLSWFLIPNGDHLLIQISGSIDGDSVFSKIDFSAVKWLTIDLSKVKQINSAGVRRWMIWVWNIEKDAGNVQVSFIKMPALMAKQVAVVSEFIPTGATVESIYITYFCPNCDQDADMLTDITGNFFDAEGEVNKSMLPACPSCTKTMAIDNTFNMEEIVRILKFKRHSEE